MNHSEAHPMSTQRETASLSRDHECDRRPEPTLGLAAHQRRNEVARTAFSPCEEDGIYSVFSSPSPARASFMLWHVLGNRKTTVFEVESWTDSTQMLSCTDSAWAI